MKLASRTTGMLLGLLLAFLLGVSASAQKGIDTQTKEIKAAGNPITSRPNDVGTSRSWGKGKTKVRDLLPNPYKLNGRRDMIMDNIAQVLRDQKMVVDEASSRLKDGIIVTQPYVFAKGSVITQSELSKYAVMDSPDAAWTRAQYTLTIEVQSIDGISNNVTVNAKVEGRGGTSVIPEWVTMRSSGLAEDDFLAKLVELVTGRSPNPVQDTDH